MKTAKLLLFLLLISSNSFSQCYSKIVSYSRCYIALQTNGTLWSKGTSFHRRLLGFGDNPPPAEFTQIGTDNNWTENLSINSDNVFAIKTDGTLWVWGRNLSEGSAGLGTFDDIPYFTPTQIGTDSNWATVAGGSSFTIATKTDGTLWAWGSNTKGQLGTGNLDDLFKTNVPIQVGSGTNWAKVFTGDASLAYAIKSDGTLWSWGNQGNFIGYVGANQNNNYRAPQQIGADTWLTISVNGFGPMTMGIKTDGSLWGWGSSNFQCYYYGNGIDIYASQVPDRIGTDSNWKEIYVGPGTTQALQTNGIRWGWGRNTNGQELGIGTGVISGVVTVVTQLGSDNDWKHLNIDIKTGFGDGIKDNNTLYHWGSNHLNVISPTPSIFSPNACTLSVEDFSTTALYAYPNPATDFVHIHLNTNSKGIAEMNLVNELGQKLLFINTEIVNQEYTLNLNSHASGVYFLTLKIKEQIFKTKIIKH